MDYKETDLNFLYDDLSREYGKKQAELLYSLMCQKYTDLCKYEIRFENDEMNEHIFNRILPTIGVYITLIENGFTKEKALAVAHEEIQRNTVIGLIMVLSGAGKKKSLSFSHQVLSA